MNYTLPINWDIDENWMYIVECLLFEWCYSQWKTKDEALSNIKEVIDICLEEKVGQNKSKNLEAITV